MKMKLKSNQKTILSILCIVLGGFILFNLAFILAALVINATIDILGTAKNTAPPFIGRLVYFILILLISWLVFRSRVHNLVKATFLTMPLMVILVMLGICLYFQPKWLIAGTGAVIIGSVLFYLYKKKLSWLYYFATIYVAILGLYIMLFNVEI